MITIKKADGTFAKVSFSEFKKMQAASPSAPVIPTRVDLPATLSLARRAGESLTSKREGSLGYARDDNKKPTHPSPLLIEGNTTTQPTHHQPSHHKAQHHTAIRHKTHTEHAKTAHHPVKHMARADAGSPLEEKLRVKSSAPLFSPKREKQVEEVLGKLDFSVAPDILGRLKSLALAKLKDIKSEDETRELLARSIKNGGLGLTESQVEKIIQSCREVEGGEGMENASVPVLKGNSFSTALHSLESELELPAPVSSPPFQGGVRGGLPKSVPGSVASATPSSLPLGKGEMTVAPEMRTGRDMISKLVAETAANESVFKLNTRPAMKQSMHDVTASSMEMGPVEEIKSITLTDFRRLSGNPEEAAKRLQQKMFNLQEESFVWYLDALSAYHLSPLYTEYMQAVCQSLAERKSLANILNMKNGIKLNEVMAIIEMERSL